MSDNVPREAASAPGVKSSPHAASRSWGLVAGLTQSRIMLGLWATAAVLDLAISMAWNWTWATPIRVATTYSAGFLLSLVGARIAYPDDATPANFSALRALAVVLPSGFALFAVDVVGRSYAHGESPIEHWPEAYILRTRINWAYFTMMFAFQFAIAWLNCSARALQVRERELLEARLSALRLQLNPHLLFNTINAVLGLVEDARGKDAERMLTRLADFLRVTLDRDPPVMVPLAAEIDMVQAYLDIEAERFGDRLEVVYTCDAGIADVAVPSFILQPLVENAIKHAVARSSGPVTVSITASASDEHVVLEVLDDGGGPGEPRASGNGVGLHNIATRLDALYGRAAHLDAHQSGSGFRAAVRLPVTH